MSVVYPVVTDLLEQYRNRIEGYPAVRVMHDPVRKVYFIALGALHVSHPPTQQDVTDEFQPHFVPVCQRPLPVNGSTIDDVVQAQIVGLGEHVGDFSVVKEEKLILAPKNPRMY